MVLSASNFNTDFISDLMSSTSSLSFTLKFNTLEIIYYIEASLLVAIPSIFAYRFSSGTA